MKAEVLGILELQSIADGYISLDSMIKSAPISVLKAEIINPGKYLIILSGDVASVEIALDTGIETGAGAVIDHLLITGLDCRVLPAFNNYSPPDEMDALGVIESVSITGAVDAADRAAKEADVDILSIKSGCETGGRGVLTINGPICDIQSALDAAVPALRAKGMLFRSVIIPGPHPDFKGFINGN